MVPHVVLVMVRRQHRGDGRLRDEPPDGRAAGRAARVDEHVADAVHARPVERTPADRARDVQPLDGAVPFDAFCDGQRPGRGRRSA